MKFRFLPKEEKFFDLFRNDVDNLKKGMEILQDLVNNYVDVDKKYEQLKEIEHKGDRITHDIFTKLRETFITPLEREDIHELASGLDDVLDCIEGVGSRLNYFKIEKPTQELIKLIDIINKAVHQIHQAVSNLEKLEHVHTFCQEINTLENQADNICREATADLFENTKKVEQLKDLIKWKEIYNRLEIAADRCEDVANVIEGIIVKSS